MNTIFLAFSIRNSSVTDFFLVLSNKLSEKYKVVIIADILEDHPFFISPAIDIIRWPSSGTTSLKGFHFLYKLIKMERPVMVISNFSSVWPFLAVGFILKVPNRIAWCHSISEQFLSKRPFLDKKKFIYKLATAIIANSEATKNDLISNFGVKGSKVEVFYNAVRNLSLKEDYPISKQIIFVGRMDVTKGVGTLLKAIPEVIKLFPDIQFKLIGGDLNGKQIKGYKAEVSALGIDKNVIFAGYKTKEVVLEEFSRSILTVVPSLVEAFGYVVIESFSVKTPVIGSNTTGIAEIIRDEQDGFLFKVGDSEDLARKIITLLNDENLRSLFSRNCYNRFSEKFEIMKVTSNLCSDLFLKIEKG